MDPPVVINSDKGIFLTFDLCYMGNKLGLNGRV